MSFDQAVFDTNCSIYGFETHKNELLLYRTPGLDSYLNDVRNYMEFMGPVILEGLEREHLRRENIKAVFRPHKSILESIPETESIQGSSQSTQDDFVLKQTPFSLKHKVPAVPAMSQISQITNQDIKRYFQAASLSDEETEVEEQLSQLRLT